MRSSPSPSPGDRFHDLYLRADKVIRRTLAASASVGPGSSDLEDIRGEVLLRLARRLADESESIASFDDYVAGMTFHAVHDFLRKRYPERTRLANRLRYHVEQRRDLEMWNHRDELVVGRAAQRTQQPRREVLAGIYDARDVRASIDRALVHGPVFFQSLVTAFDGDTETPFEAQQLPLQEHAANAADLARKLWREIEQLSERQRRAILLQMHDDRGDTGLLQFLAAGIAPDVIAAALLWSRDELQRNWPELPFDDNRIAALLGATRQQVINLRKCARERLGRRMRGW